jgi:hypothetical protein
MRAWGAGVAAGHMVLGVIGTAVLHVPGSALFFGLCAFVSLGLSQLVAPLLRRRDDGDQGGGSGARPDPEPPPWWPEFERDFQDYVQRLTSGRS